jgi:hypothetical protein
LLPEDVVKPVIKVLVYETQDGEWQLEAINAGAVAIGRSRVEAEQELVRMLTALYHVALEDGVPMTHEPHEEDALAFDTLQELHPEEGRVLRESQEMILEFVKRQTVATSSASSLRQPD